MRLTRPDLPRLVPVGFEFVPGCEGALECNKVDAAWYYYLVLIDTSNAYRSRFLPIADETMLAILKTRVAGLPFEVAFGGEKEHHKHLEQHFAHAVAQAANYNLHLERQSQSALALSLRFGEHVLWVTIEPQARAHYIITRAA